MFDRFEYKYLVAVAFVFALFMDILDTTIVNVALPTFARDFGASTTAIEWVVTGYLLSLAVFIPVSGWAGDRFGTRRTFLFAVAMFTIASLLCAVSWSIESLTAFRVLQGIGGGMLTPVGTAMLFRVFPPSERAKASAFVTIPAVVAPAAGPVVGGYLVEYASWHWIFIINVPIGLFAFLFSAAVLREERQAEPGRLDVPGLLLSASGLSLAVYALAEAGQHGFDDAKVIALGNLGIALLAALVVVELRTAKPMLDIRLFTDRLFRAANAVMLLGFAGMMGALFLLPLLLQAEMGLTPFESGLTTFPQAIGLLMFVPLSARLYPRIGPRRMMMAGMAIVSVMTFAFLLVDLDTSQWWIRLLMLVRGWGFAFNLVPMQAATFATIRPQDTGRASAISAALRQVAASLGVALIATVLTSRLVHHGAQLGNPATRDGALLAFHEAFLVAGVLAIVGIFASLLVSDREALAAARRPGHAGEPVAAVVD